MCRPATVTAGPNWNLHYTLTVGSPQISFHYGCSSDNTFVMGDWDGNRSMTPGIVRTNANGQLEWLLRNSKSSGNADYDFFYGIVGDVSVVEDWDGNGTWTCGVVRTNAWLLRNANSSGSANISFDYRSAGDWFFVWR